MTGPARKKRSDETLRMILKHLIHEFQMLQQTCELARQEDNPIVRNAFLIAFAIHARNLLDFFYAPSGPKRWPREDDVIAEDFFDNPIEWWNSRPTKSQYLLALGARVGKEVAHLTYMRLRTMSKGRLWANSSITNEMRDILLHFQSLTPSTRMGQEFVAFFRKNCGGADRSKRTPPNIGFDGRGPRMGTDLTGRITVGAHKAARRRSRRYGDNLATFLF